MLSSCLLATVLLLCCLSNTGSSRGVRGASGHAQVDQYEDQCDSQGASPLKTLAALFSAFSSPCVWRSRKPTSSNHNGHRSAFCSSSLIDKLAVQFMSPSIAGSFPWQISKHRSNIFMELDEDVHLVTMPAKVEPAGLMANILIDQRLALLAGSSGVILIDVENVRGSASFILGHAALLAAVAVWSSANQLQGRVVLVIDHGVEQQGFYLNRFGFGVVFAGPKQKADDVIAQAVKHFDQVQERPVVVVTKDSPLSTRCRRKAKNSPLHLVLPYQFIQSLVAVADGMSLASEALKGFLLDNSLAENLQEVDDEMRRAMSVSKRARLLRAREEILKDATRKSQAGSLERSLEEEVEQELAKFRPGEMLDAHEMKALQYGMKALRDTEGRGKREVTWEREILAEKLRSKFLEADDVVALVSPAPFSEEVLVSPVEDYIRSINDERARVRSKRRGKRAPLSNSVPSGFISVASSDEVLVPEKDTVTDRSGDGPLGVRIIRMLNKGSNETVTPASPIRIVVVSDTHGFEQSLTSNKIQGVPLPEGDLLIHCGDFMVDQGDQSEATAAFDKWLAQQPSTSGVRIVVRGNHDRGSANLTASQAFYLVKPTVVKVCGMTICVVPFRKGRGGAPLHIPACDVLVTHYPPKGILDKCYHGGDAGSRTLREAVMRSSEKPRLWLCGHIHESYGHELVQFRRFEVEKLSAQASFSRSTLVVNAANANAGEATKLCHPPILIEFPRELIASDSNSSVLEQSNITLQQKDKQK